MVQQAVQVNLDHSLRQTKSMMHILYIHVLETVIFIIITRFSCQRQGASADKMHVKAAIFLPLLDLPDSSKTPINRGHGAQYLYLPPAGAITCYIINIHMQAFFAC